MPAPYSPPMTPNHPSWVELVNLALQTDRQLGTRSKPGSRMGVIYSLSHQKAMALGYIGSERQWLAFVRERALENLRRS